MEPIGKVLRCDEIAAEFATATCATSDKEGTQALMAQCFAGFRIRTVEKIRHEAAALSKSKKYGAAGALSMVAKMIEEGRFDRATVEKPKTTNAQSRKSEML